MGLLEVIGLNVADAPDGYIIAFCRSDQFHEPDLWYLPGLNSLM